MVRRESEASTTTTARPEAAGRTPIAAATRRPGGDEAAFERLVEPLPPRAARALLPDARLPARRRGRAPGRAAAGLARARPLQGPRRPARLALQDRDQRQPRPARAAAASALLPVDYAAAGRSRPAAGRAGRRAGLARALPGRGARGRGRLRLPGRAATSSARRSSSPSSPRCSTCRRASGRS